MTKPRVSEDVSKESFNNYLRTLLHSRYGVATLDYDKSIRAICLHFFIHVLLMIDLLTIAILGRSSDQFFVAEIVRERLAEEFNNMKDISEFWSYLETGPINYYFQETLNPNYYHNSSSDKKWSVIAGDNLICGTIRLRQIRIPHSLCHRELYENHICFKPYTFKHNGRSADQQMSANELFITPYWIWSWISSAIAGSNFIHGKLGTYGNEGYIVNLNTSIHFNTIRIRRLKFATWIDRATRAVFIEFTTYNANVNLFCSVSLIFEIGVEGGMTSSVKVNTLKLPTYQSTQEYWALGFNISVLIFLAMYVISIISRMMIMKSCIKPFTKDLWNILDLLAFISTIIGIIEFTKLHIYAKNKMKKLSNWNTGFFNIDKEIRTYTVYTDCIGLLGCFALVRTLRFLRYVTSTHKLMRTVYVGLLSVSSFCFIFCVVFVAFSFWAFLLFGPTLQSYSTSINSAYTLFLILIGEFDYTHFTNMPFWGPLFFCQFLCLVFFVLINMFIAIIAES
ncbi:hypothetical protein GJ496_005021 [Pomphorhynchus laevis]|nr:hypothetical protein GJ496_005021 [Pomphorhynchus laevis]